MTVTHCRYASVLLLLLASNSAFSDTYSIWLPCRGMSTNANAEGRTLYIGHGRDSGMTLTERENEYCVTRVKCIALGYCKTSDPKEQAEADKIKKEMEALAEEQRRRQAERAAAKAAERRRQEEAALRKEQERQALIAEEARNRKISHQEARTLVSVREEAQSSMPPEKECYTESIPATSYQISLYYGDEQNNRRLWSDEKRRIESGNEQCTVGPMEVTEKAIFPNGFLATEWKVKEWRATVNCAAKQERYCPSKATRM